jgi:dUTP pyrophosphatase
MFVNSEQVKQGDRIAQLILEKIMIAEVAEVQELDETIRGEGGIGSTGGFATTS